MPFDIDAQADIPESEAWGPWAHAAREILKKLASVEGSTIKYQDLAEQVQINSGISTKNLTQNWIGRVVLDCQDDESPILSSLVVNKDGLVSTGYSKAIEKYDPHYSGPNLQDHARLERQTCYRYFSQKPIVDGLLSGVFLPWNPGIWDPD